jgi:non-specific serine/threonine protein kinase
MSIQAGTRLGPYEIVSHLGAGGMGVVYKSRDPRLDRLVAIKVLAPDVTRDATAKQRFLLEAKAASALGQLALFLRHGLGGNKAEALQAVNPTLTEAARLDFQHSWDMATGYALIEEREEALEWLANATHRGFINYPFLSQYDPLLKNIRQEKRFKELMEEVRSQWERFEV